jgi:hypothetical protein
MTALLAACRQYFAATFCFHARTESVGLGAATLPRLKCTLWQNNSPYPISFSIIIPALLATAAYQQPAKFPHHRM